MSAGRSPMSAGRSPMSEGGEPIGLNRIAKIS
jgi:hypothetical protein